METIQAISLWQPFATLWASGKKTTETRGWKFRGNFPVTLAVHATKRFDIDCAKLCAVEPFKSALASIGYTSAGQLPVGCVVGLVTVTGQRRFTGARPPEPECSFGDYSPGRWGWEATNFRLLAEPIPARGGQLIWGWTPPGPLVFCEPGVTPRIIHTAAEQAQRERAGRSVRPTKIVQPAAPEPSLFGA